MTARTTAADRAEISRRNGRLSRGPTSPQGKKRSCMNSIKHGMTARLPVLPGEDEAAFCRLVDDVSDALGPRDAVEVVLAEQVASATWRIARAERCEAARVSAALRAAEADAGLQTHDEVAAMGHWLLTDTLRARQNAAASLFPFLSEDRHDPFRRGRGDPRHIVLRLEATALGCQWLLEQWTRLGRRLERGHDWRTNELIVALHLRGQRPLGADLLEWGGLLEPAAADGEPEVVAQARRALLLQLDEGVPRDPAGLRAALGRLVREETERLQRRKAAHERREAADRAELADRLAVDTTEDGERMRRYQLDFDRKLHRALNTLLKLRRGGDVGIGVAGDPAPDDTPELDPAPEPVRTVEPEGGPADGLQGETDAAVRPKTEGDSPEDECVLAGGCPSSFGVDPSFIPEPERLAPAVAVAVAAAESAAAGIAAPARSAAEPEGHPVPQNEPATAAEGERIPQNEPSPLAAGDQIPQNEPSRSPEGERIPQNEPGPPADGERIPQDEQSAWVPRSGGGEAGSEADSAPARRDDGDRTRAALSSTEGSSGRSAHQRDGPITMMIAALLVSVGIGLCTFAEGPAQRPPVPIAGTVVDADRRPAASAGVYFSVRRWGGDFGEVVARTESDAQGRFRLEVPGWPGGGPWAGILWAYRPGALVATYSVSRETLPPDSPVSMVLDHPARAEFLVRGLDGRPVAGARIQPRSLNRDFLSVPDGLAERIEAQAVTDDRGRAVLTAFFAEEVSSFYVSAPGLGWQHFSFGFRGEKQDLRTIDLAPVGRVEGQIVADDPEIVRGWKLEMRMVGDRRPGASAQGLFHLTTDPQGRFAVPEAPTGALGVMGAPPAGSPWFLRSSGDLKFVEAGRTTRMEIKPFKGVRLKGVVRTGHGGADRGCQSRSRGGRE